MKILAGILMSLYLGLTLFGLYQYKAHNRSWGMKLVVWMSGLVLLVGVTARLAVYLESSLPLFLVAGFCLAYFVGWRVIGRRFTGWKQHLVRGLAFALCLGPIAAVRCSELEDFPHWLEALADMPFTDMLKLTLYGLPGFFLVGAFSFLVSTGHEIWRVEGRRFTGIVLSRRAKLGYSLLLLALLLSVNWYVAGAFLYYSAKKGHTGILSYVLWSRPGSVNAKDRYGRTSLHLAAWHGQMQAVRVLLEAGANANAKGECKETPLHYATMKGHTKVVKILLKAGAEVNAKSGWGHTPLHLAASRGKAEMVKMLLEAGAEVNARIYNDQTPLHVAAWSGHTETVKVIIKAGPEVNAKDKDGKTPLDRARNATQAIGRSPGKGIPGPWTIKPETRAKFAECADLLRKHGGKTGAELDAEAKQGKQER